MTKRNRTNVAYDNSCVSITATVGDGGINTTGMSTEQWFNGAIKIELQAKTNGSLCVLYHCGALLLNRKQNADGLIIFDIPNSKQHGYERGGWLPDNEFVDIEWIIGKEVMSVKVNGELRHVGNHYDYIGLLKRTPDYEICSPVRVNAAYGSTVTIESLRVTEL